MRPSLHNIVKVLREAPSALAPYTDIANKHIQFLSDNNKSYTAVYWASGGCIYQLHQKITIVKLSIIPHEAGITVILYLLLI